MAYRVAFRVIIFVMASVRVARIVGNAALTLAKSTLVRHRATHLSSPTNQAAPFGTRAYLYWEL